MERRIVSSRANKAIQGLSRLLARSAVTPNQISVASCVFAAAVPLGLNYLGGTLGALVALAGVQLRLLANVVDGLVAVEGGKATKLGALYNEFPDRIADSVILVSVGYACGVSELGWISALLAALTAYVRVFGGALGQPQTFQGPMAKQHRMAVVSLALLVFAAGQGWSHMLPAVQGLLAVIAVGSAATCWTRMLAIATRLKGDAP